MLNRRQFILLPALLGASLAPLSKGSAAVVARLPDDRKFESGDLLWPKKPGAFIPYSNTPGRSAMEDRERWYAEKNILLQKAREGKIANADAIIAELRDLSYEEFQNRYLQGQPKEGITPYAAGSVAAVGHIGIIETDSQGTSYVIEALWQPGVTRHRYSDWIDSRPGEIVWHGRLLDKTRAERTGIAAEAKKQIGKPYDFWDLDLSSEKGFYCSKLAWLSIFGATKVAVDGNPNPQRAFWLSPKQILYSPRIERLHDPGDYAWE